MVAGVMLLPFQWFPPMPLPGMQLSDILFGVAFALLVLRRPVLPPGDVMLALALFAAGATIAIANGGSPVKLLGHYMLVAICAMAATVPPTLAFRLRQALVAAAFFGSLAAIAGLALHAAGEAHYDALGWPDHPLLYHHGALQAGDYPRPRGTFVTGALMTSVICNGLILLWFDPGLLRLRWARTIVYALGLAAVFFAFSRSLGVMLFVVSGFELWRRRTPGSIRVAWVVAMLAAIILLALSLRYRVILDPTQFWAVGLADEPGDRWERWLKAIERIVENPLVGAGPGVAVANGWTAHNTILNTWAVLGLVPLLAFLYLFYRAGRATWRARALPLSAALTFAGIQSLYSDFEDLRHLWILFGLAVATTFVAGTGAAPAGQPPRLQRLRRSER